MEDYCHQITPKGGLNLALLLPFIGNLGGTIEEQVSDPMFVEEPFAYLLESELFNLSHFLNSSNEPNSHLSNQQFNLRESSGQLGTFKNGTHYASNPFDFDDFHSRIWRKNDFSFYHCRRSNDRLSIEEGDSKSQIYIKQCWEEFQSKCESKLCNDALDMDLQRVSDAWKEIMKNLRNVEHQKAQTLMEELGKLPMNSCNYFGKGIQPSMIFWTSGGRFQYANESFCKLTGYNIDELQDAKNNIIGAYAIFHPEEVMRILKRQLEAIHQPDKSSYQMNTKLIGKYSKEISVSCSVVNVRDTLNGLPTVTMAIFI
jgi:PAS domain S-box-containing protein